MNDLWYKISNFNFKNFQYYFCFYDKYKIFISIKYIHFHDICYIHDVIVSGKSELLQGAVIIVSSNFSDAEHQIYWRYSCLLYLAALFQQSHDYRAYNERKALIEF
jgi:hypothetical protein